MTMATTKLVSSRALAKNAMWNFTGLVVPLVVALYTIPLLIEGMGSERFGLLAVIWVGVGYFSLFDFGLGRALTKLVSERLGNGKTFDLGSLIWTAFAVLFAVSLIGAFLIAVCNTILVEGLLNANHVLRQEGPVPLSICWPLAYP
jgi:O-antigen/teichoic acid export membrane protein